jgi:hypothetical protein
MLEASVISPRLGFLDIKIYEDNIFHHFTLKTPNTEYYIRKTSGELIAKANATFEIKDTIIINTDTHVFEIVQAENYSYKAHKKLKKEVNIPRK